MNDTILIVDDMEINRAILAEAFKSEYTILEAESGREALKILNSDAKVSAILLDLIMPEMDGLDVLSGMNRSGLIQRIPVFIITAAESSRLLLNAYDLGAVDVIRKPFMVQFLKCRVNNMIELYKHRNDLERTVNDQVDRLNSINMSMVETLATIVEFRDSESGEHVRRIRELTDVLITRVSDTYPEYYLPRKEIDKIVMASVLHDVGKISIPDSILNKPGRLTKEEFELMKLHTVKGCELLEKIADIVEKDIYGYSYDICRHHHERWDGGGYPDGLQGDEIDIWSQVVAIADVYDALTSKRVYKDAYTHDTAVQMIFNGECGTFNPKILNVFDELEKRIEKK